LKTGVYRVSEGAIASRPLWIRQMLSGWTIDRINRRLYPDTAFAGRFGNDGAFSIARLPTQRRTAAAGKPHAAAISRLISMNGCGSTS
jgi:hypothetical protein